MKLILSAIAILFSAAAIGQTSASEKLQQAKASVQEATDAIKESALKTQANSIAIRELSSMGFLAQYSLFDLIVPGKYGVSAYKQYEDKMYEAEYLRGTMSIPLVIANIGGVTDQRFTLRVRKFSPTGNFNWYWGVTYFAFDAKLGTDILNTIVPGQAVPDVDLAKHRALGFDLGFGHRWHFASNFAFGVDWISWSQPLITLEKDIPFLKSSGAQSAKDKVEKALNIAGYTPRLSLLKLSLGYVF